MMRRKGFGQGKGQGYRNLISGYDSRIHSLSAQGHRQPQWQMIYNCRCNKRLCDMQKLVNELKSRRLSDVKFTGDRISLKFGNKKISNPVKYNPTVKNIANWAHSKKDDRVFIDKDAPYPAQLAVHEAIEQYVSETYGLKYREAHDIATHFEKKAARQNGTHWGKSQDGIFKTKI